MTPLERHVLEQAESAYTAHRLFYLTHGNASPDASRMALEDVLQGLGHTFADLRSRGLFPFREASGIVGP